MPRRYVLYDYDAIKKTKSNPETFTDYIEAMEEAIKQARQWCEDEEPNTRILKWFDNKKHEAEIYLIIGSSDFGKLLQVVY